MKNDPDHPAVMSDPLDALLRDAEGYIPDNGFTARVMKSLPSRRRRDWRRFIVLSVSLLAGTGLIAWQYPAVVSAVSEVLNPASASACPMLIVLAPVLAALASLAWGVYAIISDED